MDFVGTARRLGQGDVGEAARDINVPTAALLAVMEVEARGSGFDARRRPIILYEPHLFHRELRAHPAAQARATAQGLAYARWGAQPYPRGSDAQYARLGRAIAIDLPAALRACSWGLAQILGSNHRDAGFPDPRAMVEAFMLGERQQLDAMCRLIAAWGLDRAMRDFGREDRRGETTFARRYNGPGYARNAYHTKIATAFAKHSKGEVMEPVRSPTLRPGSKGEAVRALQADLVTLGFAPGPVDGRFGPATTSALRAAQTALGLPVDGVFGPTSRAALEAAVASRDVDPGGTEDAWTEREPELPARSPSIVLAEIRERLVELETLVGA